MGADVWPLAKTREKVHIGWVVLRNQIPLNKWFWHAHLTRTCISAVYQFDRCRQHGEKGHIAWECNKNHKCTLCEIRNTRTAERGSSETNSRALLRGRLRILANDLIVELCLVNLWLSHGISWNTSKHSIYKNHKKMKPNGWVPAPQKIGRTSGSSAKAMDEQAFKDVLLD